MIIINQPDDDGPIPEGLLYVRRDVNLLWLFKILDEAGFDIAMRTDGKPVLQPAWSQNDP